MSKKTRSRNVAEHRRRLKRTRARLLRLFEAKVIIYFLVEEACRESTVVDSTQVDGGSFETVVRA